MITTRNEILETLLIFQIEKNGTTRIIRYTLTPVINYRAENFIKNSMKYKKLLPIVKYDDYIKEWDYEKTKTIIQIP